MYSRCRCDDTDNVALRDIETGNRSIECSDYAVYRNVSMRLWETKQFGWAVAPIGLRRNGR